MSKPYTNEELKNVIVNTPVQGTFVETILNLVIELTEEYYDAGYQEGRSDALSHF